MLSWVKQWDHCVFGESSSSFSEKNAKNSDKYNRPDKRILLLSGPPGYGKTTLAQIVAKVCKYNVIEINAR